jgi:periplasmic divalent cation tolerance protein
MITISSMSSHHVVVVSTTDSEHIAHALATAAIESGLGACAQILGPITSIFRWDSQMQTQQQWRVEIKTAADRVKPLSEYITAHHNDDVPELIVVPIEGGSSEYLSWIIDQTR